jgi:hypothetical protein
MEIEPAEEGERERKKKQSGARVSVLLVDHVAMSAVVSPPAGVNVSRGLRGN